MSSTIETIVAEEIADSRGKPTMRVRVVTKGGHSGIFSVPSGASTGDSEALEMRDADGGVRGAIAIVNGKINDALHGVDVSDQKHIDTVLCELDGTENKSVLGGNSTIGVSCAAASAAADAAGLPLYAYLRTLADIAPSRATPYLFVNLINGGKHAKGGSVIQEHQIIPQTDDVREAIAVVQASEQALHESLTEDGVQFGIGDEGGVVFAVRDVVEPFDILQRVIEQTKGASTVALGADAAASSFFANGVYDVLGKQMTTEGLQTLYEQLHNSHGLMYLEDPFEEHDFDAFSALHKEPSAPLLIGDDLTTTHAGRIAQAVAQDSIGAVIIKPNQVGTLSETLGAMGAARAGGLHCVISHRSGETDDTFIADLCVAFGCFGLKAGAPSKQERMVKYQRLVDIIYGEK